MTAPVSTVARRTALLAQLFPGGVPLLWCPPLTHYNSRGAIDGPRILAHLRHLSKHVKGFLIPGSTGDGWELNPDEDRQLLRVALPEVQRFGGHVLVGVLKTDGQETLKCLRETAAWLTSEP